MDLRYSIHAVQRAYQWDVTDDSVRAVLAHTEVIEKYPDDTPFPSRLMLGWDAMGPIHVVAATDPSGVVVIITVYRPDPREWDATYRERKSPDDLASTSAKRGRRHRGPRRRRSMTRRRQL